MLRLVIPKGSLEQQTLRLFEEADLRVRRGSDRDYHGTIDDERIERVSLLRPQEIPTYVQDGLFDLGITGQDWIAETGADVEVLMVAWANREALERTLAEGRMVYWSRSRKELWRKGDTSGHTQHWDELRVDCDGDVLLARVHQEGPACHTGERTCFHRRL